MINLLDKPMCAKLNERITISSTIKEGGITIIGYGIIINGFPSEIVY
jgi:translation initiation factor 2 gamma subunit (eIF-2gamma)